MVNQRDQNLRNIIKDILDNQRKMQEDILLVITLAKETHDQTNANQLKFLITFGKQIDVDETDNDSPIDLSKEVEIERKVNSRIKLKLRDKIERLEKMILGMKKANDLLIYMGTCHFSLKPIYHLSLRYQR